MRLWLLKPRLSLDNNPWNPWYDKAFGFVVRAETENEARQIAQKNGGDEIYHHKRVESTPVWIDPTLSTCIELTPDGGAGVVLRDFRQA